jgi:peptide subunit release factor 1 (eRF1)
MAIDAPVKDVLDTVLARYQQHERDTEIQIVREVVTAAAKKQKGVTGLSHTLNAVNQGRVWQLIYSDGLSSPGFECQGCASLFSAETPSCFYCGGKLQPVDDVIERAVEHGLRQGARIEVVKGEASASLKVSGGIGAFLKARTASIQG